MKLLKVDTLAQARERLLKAAKECLPETEQVALADASDRILAEDIVSGEMIPAFRRSSVDGYAVCSKDTAGATESIPVFLKVLEEVEIGHPAVSKIEPGTCAYVPTGGMVPEGADAMVMVEYSERFGTDEVALYENVPYGKCIVLPGEDVKTGDTVLKAGTRIGPAQAGTLAALGVVQVPVFKPWKVAVLSTGDELVRIDQVPGPGQVRDINTWALSCYVKKTGLGGVFGVLVRYRYLEGVVVLFWILAGVLCVWKRKMEQTNPESKPGRWIWRGWCAVLILGCLAVAFVLYDANLGGHAERYSALSQYLVFDDDWGTNRGYCGRIGWQSYRELPFLHQLFGFGPDTYGILTWDFRQDALDRYGVFYESAHNEYFQYLVTMGPLALVSYLAFLGGTCVQMCKKWKECAWILAPVLAVLCYGAQAVVNINLPIATPIMWAMLAIGLALTREKAEQAE